MKKKKLTTSAGAVVSDNQNSLTAGQHGPTLMQDHVLLNKLAHFNRERIPERVVHAKAAGAHGTFTVTGDITKYTLMYEEALPGMMGAYTALRDEAYKDGALSHKVKRLIALGIALRAGCTGCILYQTKAAVEAGATKAEVLEAVSVAIAMSGSTALGWSWRVVKILEELGEW